MDQGRRRLVTTLSAAGAALMVPAPSLAARVGPDEARTMGFIPAAALSEAQRKRHERYMAMAIELIAKDSGPFGSVIVDRERDEVVCSGKVAYRENPIFHGEIVAINDCAKHRPRVEWSNLTLYTTAEPCPMCQSAVLWTGISQVVYGTSIQDMIQFGINQIRLESLTVAAAAPFYEGSIVGGVLKERTDEIIRAWAVARRQRRG